MRATAAPAWALAMAALGDADAQQRPLHRGPRPRQVGRLLEALLDGALRLAAVPASAASRSISDARSASSAMTTTLSGRTWRNPPAMAKYSSSAALADAQLPDAERREQRGVMRQDAELALGARADDGVDVVRVDLPLGRDDLELEGHR